MAWAIVPVRLTVGAARLRVNGQVVVLGRMQGTAPPSIVYSAAVTLLFPVVESSPVALIATPTEPFVRLGARTSALVIGPVVSVVAGVKMKAA